MPPEALTDVVPLNVPPPPVPAGAPPGGVGPAVPGAEIPKDDPEVVPLLEASRESTAPCGDDGRSGHEVWLRAPVVRDPFAAREEADAPRAEVDQEG